MFNPLDILKAPFKKDSLGLTPTDWFKLWLRRDEMLSKLKSRKLWATVAATAFAALGSQLGLDPSTVNSIVAVITKYILIQGAVDTAKEVFTKPAEPAPFVKESI